MRRFLRPGHDPVRERLKRDLFQFNKVWGFPQTSRQIYPEPLHPAKGGINYLSVGGKVKFRRGGLFSFQFCPFLPRWAWVVSFKLLGMFSILCLLFKRKDIVMLFSTTCWKKRSSQQLFYPLSGLSLVLLCAGTVSITGSPFVRKINIFLNIHISHSLWCSWSLSSLSLIIFWIYKCTSAFKCAFKRT